MQGNVLAIRDEGIEDEFGRQYIGLVIQINPDKDRFVQTADPDLHAQILELNKGDLVYVTSEWHRNSSGRGFHARAKTITVLAPASTPGPVAVEAALPKRWHRQPNLRADSIPHRGLGFCM